MTATSFTVGVTGCAVHTTDEDARAATIQEDPVGGIRVSLVGRSDKYKDYLQGRRVPETAPRIQDDKMPERDGESIRKAALPWYGKIVIGAYLKSHQARYGEDFLELVSEGYRTYVDGNARASMIVTGEALLRILYARIAEMLQNGPLTVRQGARTIRIRPSSIYDLQDELTFAQAERVLSAYLDPAVYEQVDAVRFLRNRAAHADLPMLDEWDPRDPRSAEDFFDLLSDQTSIPEAYRFHKGDTWVTIFVKDHPCNTMHDLSTSEKLAAIQQLFVISIIKNLLFLDQ